MAKIECIKGEIGRRVEFVNLDRGETFVLPLGHQILMKLAEDSAVYLHNGCVKFVEEKTLVCVAKATLNWEYV